MAVTAPKKGTVLTHDVLRACFVSMESGVIVGPLPAVEPYVDAAPWFDARYSGFILRCLARDVLDLSELLPSFPVELCDLVVQYAASINTFEYHAVGCHRDGSCLCHGS